MPEAKTVPSRRSAVFPFRPGRLHAEDSESASGQDASRTPGCRQDAGAGIILRQSVSRIPDRWNIGTG